MIGTVFILNNVIFYTVAFLCFSQYLCSRSECCFVSQFGFNSEEYPLTSGLFCPKGEPTEIKK